MDTGTKIGRYEILKKIGFGGTGEVYLAKDPELDRLVALKVLHPSSATDDDLVHRFIQEAKAASALNHPNILTVHEIGTFQNARFLATEYIKGVTLRDRFKGESMTLGETLDIILQVAAALKAAHNAGIVHRDIKPENIMIREDGLAKVLDFGLAKLSEPVVGSVDVDVATQFETRPGMFMGTPHYVSPEQARAMKVDARSDIWSTGVVLFEMLTNQRPFTGETLPDVLSAILTGEPARLDESVPPELRRILKKSLEKKPDDRYQTTKDFLIDIKNLKRELEFTEGLGRSHFSASTRSTTGGLTGAISARKSLAHTASSAEFVVAEIRKHKFGTLATFLILLLGSTGLGYWYLTRPWFAGINSIAVLPFANVGNDPNNEYLSDGLSETLINKLSQIGPELKVIARTSAFQYKGREIDPKEVGKALGVQAIVTGRVTQRGDTLNISAEMINTMDQTRIWGESYDRKVSDAQNIQEEIARTVSEKLRVRLSGAQEKQLAKQATQNSQAYQRYLNGLFYSRKGGAENVRKALDYYNEALALDPSFALAYVGVASAYGFFGANSLVNPQEAEAQAKAAVEKALELDETLSEAHVALARINRNGWAWAAAERGYLRAIELNPNFSRAHDSYALYLSVLGRQTEALKEIKRAQELDPLDSVARVSEGQILYDARRYDEAIQQFQSILKAEPDDSFTLAYLGYVYASKGDFPEAISHYRKYIEIEGETSSTQCYLGYALAKSGHRNEALELLNKVKTTKEYVSPGELATLYSGLGDNEQAMASLEKAYAAHDIQLQFLKVEPHYDSLRSDPRFADIMRRVGLPVG
jgi:serine/threonine protein kinase/Tfp pilus assembly protein PilF